MNALEWNEGLNLAAKEHCNDLGPQGLRGHFGTDESSPFDRISKYGKPGWWRGENLRFGVNALKGMTADEADKEALRIVLSLFIDEGLAGRPSRHRMLNQEFNLVGIYSCPHKNADAAMTVIDYAGTLKLNENTRQGVMEAQEFNAKNADTNEDDDDDSNTKCSKINQVTDYDCARFNLVNNIR